MCMLYSTIMTNERDDRGYGAVRRNETKRTEPKRNELSKSEIVTSWKLPRENHIQLLRRRDANLPWFDRLSFRRRRIRTQQVFVPKKEESFIPNKLPQRTRTYRTCQSFPQKSEKQNQFAPRSRIANEKTRKRKFLPSVALGAIRSKAAKALQKLVLFMNGADLIDRNALDAKFLSSNYESVLDAQSHFFAIDLPKIPSDLRPVKTLDLRKEPGKQRGFEEAHHYQRNDTDISQVAMMTAPPMGPPPMSRSTKTERNNLPPMTSKKKKPRYAVAPQIQVAVNLDEYHDLVHKTRGIHTSIQRDLDLRLSQGTMQKFNSYKENVVEIQRLHKLHNVSAALPSFPAFSRAKEIQKPDRTRKNAVAGSSSNAHGRTNDNVQAGSSRNVHNRNLPGDEYYLANDVVEYEPALDYPQNEWVARKNPQSHENHERRVPR